MSNDLKKAIKNAALRLLGHREYSQYLLARKLISKGFEKILVKEVLLELSKCNWLSDSRFAEHFTNSRADKGYGPLRIQLELKEKGIPESIIADILSVEDARWEKLANNVRQKKFGNEKATDFAAKAKQMKFLQYRGFNAAQIKFALNQSDEIFFYEDEYN